MELPVVCRLVAALVQGGCHPDDPEMLKGLFQGKGPPLGLLKVQERELGSCNKVKLKVYYLCLYERFSPP